MEKMIDERKEDKFINNEDKEKNIIKISELERNLREFSSENMRLRQDYQRLGEILQSAVNKSIFQTFIDNKFF